MSTITSRLGGFFRRMRLDEPVRIELQSTRRIEAPQIQRTAASLERMADGEAQPVSRGGLLSRLPGARRDAAIAQLQQGYGEVRELMRSMQTHMDQQSQRGERLLDLLACMPDALRAIPESNRNQSHMLEALHTHIDQQGRSAQQLSTAIASLASAAQQQSQVMGAMQQQSQAAAKHDEHRYAGLTAMNTSLEKMSVASEAGVETLRRVCNSTMRSEDRMEDLMRRNARHMTALTLVIGSLAATSLGVAVYAVMFISKAV